ncbi:MAG TPA: DUF2764 family protein [Sunxiuqinia sp.]|nr:DUF2764 family protein [Sunxiuqinia sp.]
MNLYYSFITELPDLEFDPDAKFDLPDQFLAHHRDKLQPEDLELVRLLWYQKFHDKVVEFLIGELESDEPLLRFDLSVFQSEAEDFHKLPNYLQNLVIWSESQQEQSPRMQVAQKLQTLYFEQLLGSENQFLQQWAEKELNLVNFLAARRCEILSVDKNKQLIHGNEYVDLLLEYPTAEKIVRTEFSVASQLVSILENNNYQEREFAVDKIRWNLIDEINRFEYFTVDVVLGYFQRLMLLERWTTIFQSDKTVNPVEIANNLVKEKLR